MTKLAKSRRTYQIAYDIEEPRIRRSRGAHKRISPSKGRKRPKTAVVTPPPVVVRREIPAHPVSEKRHTRARRRFDVALPIPGAEISLPMLPALHLSWRILSGVMVMVLVSSLYLLWTMPTFRVPGPQVSGLQRITLADVETVIGLSDQPVFTVDPNSIQQDLQQAFPEMSAITVEVHLPAAVIVNVAERTPLIDWKDGDREVWVDGNGVAFPPRGEAGKLVVVEGQIDMPVITGTVRTAAPFVDPKMVSAVLEMAKLAPKKATIIYDADHGLGWNDARGWQVFFGLDVNNMDTKLMVYQALVKKLKADGVEPAFVSVEYADAPYYRMER
jgi:cell division septal protein FtsQ